MNEKINIEFQNLSYDAKMIYDVLGINRKTILKEINGQFRGCEVTAIVGPSGSGKTTLLNILTGFETSNISGSIRVNGKPRDLNSFKKQSTYIMQEQNLHSLLTLRETMNFSIKLKTGRALSRQQRDDKIMHILEHLGLDLHVDTYVKNLSGGQKKRLSIALELVDDPAILFLDEPTTGLDSSASTQCVRLLKTLAQEGKTIICTVHTPSALVLEMFDHLYALADGYCVYQGAVKNLVPFLRELELECPKTYNPSDFLLEVANNDYGPLNEFLVEKIKNGNNNNYRQLSHHRFILSNSKKIPQNELPPDFSPSFVNQVYQLTMRNMLFNRRDKSYVLNRFVVYLLVAVLMGIMYYDIGNDANQMINIFKCIYLMVAALMYTGLYSLAIRFTIDMPIIQREHFNRYYSTGAHYLALNIADIPILAVNTIIFTVVAYIMTNHPLEEFRLSTVLAVGLALSFTSQVYGIFAGVWVNLKLSLLFAALLMVYQIIFSGGLVFMQDVHPFWHWMFEISFMKHALDGCGAAILGFDRPKLECDEMYCHFVSPQKFLKIIDMRQDIPRVFYSFLAIWIIFHFLTYSVMRFRLRR